MISILTGDNTWDMYPNTKIRFRLNHPAFGDEVQVGSYTLPITLPLTANNQKMLNFANLRHNTAPKNTVFACDLHIGTIYFFSGIFTVTEIKDDEFSGDLSLDIGVFINKIGELKLNSEALDFEDIALERAAALTIAQINILADSIPDAPSDGNDYRCFGFFKAKNFDTTNYESSLYEVNEFTPENIKNILHSICLIVNGYYNTGGTSYFPALKMTYSYNRLTAEKRNVSQSLDCSVVFRYRRTDNPAIYTDHTYTLAIFSLNPITDTIDYESFVFGFTKNQGFYNGKNLEHLTWVNGTIDLISSDWYLTPHHEFWYHYEGNTNALVPYFRLVYLFEKLSQYSGFSFSGAWLDDAELQNLVIYNTYSVDELNAQGLNIFASEVNAKNHLPDTLIREYLRELSRNLNFYYDFAFRSNACELVYRHDLLEADIVDWSEKIFVGFVSPQEEPANIRLAYNESMQVKNYENQLPAVTSGSYAKNEDFPLEIGTLPITVAGSIETSVAVDDIPGNSPLYDLGLKNAYENRLLLFRPSSGKATSKAESGDNYSLEIAGAKGLFAQRHEKWIKFSQTAKTYKQKIKLNFADIMNWRWNRRYAFQHEIFFIKSLEFEITNQGINPISEVELVKQA